MQFGNHKDVQNAVQKIMDSLEDNLLPQEYEEPTYKSDPNAEHDPLSTMEMARPRSKK